MVDQLTIEYYNKNTKEYIEKIESVNLSALYRRFCSLIPSGGLILDVGCGSGRDLLAFKKMGFQAIGVDPSSKLARYAEKYSGVSCYVCGVEDIQYDSLFDGVWACASLLHLPKSSLSSAFNKMHDALKDSGVLYLSLREGVGELRLDDGRLFSSYSSEELKKMILVNGRFEVVANWKTQDAVGRGEEIVWINFLLRKNHFNHSIYG